MKVSVDPKKCQGHGRCMMFDGDLFDCDELGYAVVRGDGQVPESAREAAWLAEANCPEGAITLDKQGEG